MEPTIRQDDDSFFQVTTDDRAYELIEKSVLDEYIYEALMQMERLYHPIAESKDPITLTWANNLIQEIIDNDDNIVLTDIQKNEFAILIQEYVEEYVEEYIDLNIQMD